LTSPEPQGPGPHRGAAFWLTFAVALGVGLANVAKPVHIDDMLYLTIARWIASHPFDPYGGTITWQQIPEPTYNVSISPPLLSYVFALVIALAGENVVLLHVTMVPWVLVACWAIYRLGERFADAGAATALLVLLGPAVTAGMNLMLDVPLLACIGAAVECLLRGVERDNGRWIVAAALFGAAGVLIKFPALALVPVFLVVAWRRRRWGPLLAMAGPIGALVAWQAASRALYGATQVHAGLSFLSQFRSSFLRQVAERKLTMLALVAWTFPVWMLAPGRLAWRARIVAGSAAAAAVATAAALLGPRCWERPVQSSVFVTGAGLGAFAFMAGLLPAASTAKPHLGREGDDPRLLLWTWILGTLAIVIPFGPFVAVRSFLAIHPPLAMLLIGRGPARRIPLGATLGMTAVLGAALWAADFHWAACYPATVRQLAAEWRSKGRPILFLGHWGWQYYAERAGFQPWDARWRQVPSDSVVIIPQRADRQWIHPDVLRRLALRKRITIPHGPLGLTTWNRALGIRFYGGDYGELPWGFSWQPAEEFFVFEIASSSGRMGDPGPHTRGRTRLLVRRDHHPQLRLRRGPARPLDLAGVARAPALQRVLRGPPPLFHTAGADRPHVDRSLRSAPGPAPLQHGRQLLVPGRPGRSGLAPRRHEAALGLARRGLCRVSSPGARLPG
jgi:4-amino-4-deoxy-L-arabinose transferase-like glycosyltransferase